MAKNAVINNQKGLKIVSKTKLMLDKAIEYWGMNDIVTIMLSQRRDREIIESQRRRLKQWERK